MQASMGMVREMGLEPTRHATHAPQTCLSTNSSTLAYRVNDAKVIIANGDRFVNS